MGKRTGNPRGRPKGSRNKRTEEMIAKAEETAAAIEQALDVSFQGDAHALLMSVYKDPSQMIALRVEAARAAIRYEKPALAMIDVTSVNEHVVRTVSGDPITADEWAAEFGSAAH